MNYRAVYILLACLAVALLALGFTHVLGWGWVALSAFVLFLIFLSVDGHEAKHL